MKRLSVLVCTSLFTAGLLATLTLNPITQALAEQGAAKVFQLPEAAVAALIDAAKSKDAGSILAVLGSGAKELITSGDPVQDEQARKRFIAAYNEKHDIVKAADKKAILVIGNDGFPFPFPIVRSATGWAFDLEQGKDELLNRRIGENELNTIQVLLAITSAQREYARADWDGDGLLVYASKFRSTAGKRDGLYWPTGEGEPTSPLGSLVAQAAREGYTAKKDASQSNETSVYHGYRFKLLKRQGARAPGGAYSYVVGGKLLGGFAVLAYPAKYGGSGIMTFMVNHDGTVHEADLGPQTQTAARAIGEFNPGGDWKKVAPE